LPLQRGLIGTAAVSQPRPTTAPHRRDDPPMTAIDITTDRYLRSLSEVAAADSMAALVTRGDIVRLTELVDVAVAARCGWTADPVRPGDQRESQP